MLEHIAANYQAVELVRKWPWWHKTNNWSDVFYSQEALLNSLEPGKTYRVYRIGSNGAGRKTRMRDIKLEDAPYS